MKHINFGSGRTHFSSISYLNKTSTSPASTPTSLAAFGKAPNSKHKNEDGVRSFVRTFNSLSSKRPSVHTIINNGHEDSDKSSWKTLEFSNKGKDENVSKQNAPGISKVTGTDDAPSTPSECFFCGRKLYGPKCRTREGLLLHNDCYQCSICGLQLSGIASQEAYFLDGKFYCEIHGEQVRRLSVLDGGGSTGKPLPDLNATMTTKKPTTISDIRNTKRDDLPTAPPKTYSSWSLTKHRNFDDNLFMKNRSKFDSKGTAGAIDSKFLIRSGSNVHSSTTKQDQEKRLKFNIENVLKPTSDLRQKKFTLNSKIGKINPPFIKTTEPQKRDCISSNSGDEHCAACGNKLEGSMVRSKEKSWCPEHFVCANSACARPLLDCGGFIEADSDKNYCPNCYDCLIAPSCHKCALPLTEFCLNALGKQWHPECFCCTHCRKPFGNLSFYLENDKPYCEDDWNILFAKKCEACRQPIKVGQCLIESLGTTFHNKCFNCYECNVNLEGQVFLEKNNKPFCRAHARSAIRG